MSFIYENFKQVGFNHSGSPACFSYSTTDKLSEVQTSGYFSDPRATIGAGDYLLVYANGESQILVALNNNSVGLGHPENIVFIDSLSNFPQPQTGVITLADNVTYYIANEIDLNGNRLVAGQNTTIVGSSSENCRIKSTGLADPLITSQYSLPLRHLSLEAQTIFDLDAGATPNQALDWYGVNLVNSSDIGTIANYANFIASSMAFLSSSGLVFDGTIGTIALSETLFSGTDPGTIIEIPGTATITRRLRVIYSSFVVSGSGVGINVSVSASIPVEGYILDTVNFSGGGTYTQGVLFDDNKSRWTECRGVQNSAAITGYYMQGNATATVITTTETPVKAEGATTQYAISQKFTHANNRVTYGGSITRDFKVTAIASISSGATNQIGIYIAKNGQVVTESETYITANAAGRLENGSAHTIVELQENDYIEIYVENNTSTSNITVEDLNVIIEALN